LLSWIVLFILGVHDLSYKRIYDPINNVARFHGKCGDYMATLALNPYLGFVHSKECSDNNYKVNNLGLLNRDVESDFDRKLFAVGIFGGSVASQFAGLNGTSQLEEILNSCYSNKFQKQFAVYNFADGAWKQPHQVIALSLYQDYLDAAISIEGFNEHYFMGSKSDLLLPARNFFILEDGFNFLSEIYYWLRYIERTPLRYSNFVKALVYKYRLVLVKLENKRISQKESIYTQIVKNPDIHNLKRYQGFLRSFEGIAKAQNIYSLVVAQPVPLYKKLTKNESKVVGPLDYESKYNEVIKAISNGAKNYIDLSKLFMESSDEIYADPIHFIVLENNKSQGNYYMAVKVLSKMERDGQIIPKKNLANCVKKWAPKDLQ
jgi:hypothetical protein